jgi:S-adenosyl methyltransferase
MSIGDDWRTTFRPDVPSPARMYNYFLGGKDNYPADREAAEHIIEASPGVLLFARENRAFLRVADRAFRDSACYA